MQRVFAIDHSSQNQFNLSQDKSGYNSGNFPQAEVSVKHGYAYRRLAILAGFFVLVSNLQAQSPANPARIGLVQDWTQHHIVFSRDGLLKNPSLLNREPRIMHQAMQRWQGAQPQLSGEASNATAFAAPARDWNVSLGLGRIAPNMFPAKYSFDPAATPDCTKDYVAFGLNRVGAANQANLVALNNLYTGTLPTGICGSGAPTFLFAYNISTVGAGRILTSPALSLDGKKIAFVESGNVSGVSTSVFHVLTWVAGDGTSATTPAVPGGKMTSLTFAAALDTRSSVWVDYNTDIGYVGADDGKIYKITGVFKGTPTLAGAPWPVTISPNIRASTPVLDKNLGLVLVGSQNGTYYSIDATNGVVKSLVVGRSGGTNPGILTAPVVDVSNGTSFVISANDGTSGVIVEVDSATMTQLAKGQIGQASHSGTAISLFQPAFSDSYFNNPATGTVRLCGTGAADNTPWQYAFGGFTLNAQGKYVMNQTPTFSAQLLISTTARCTGWTEFLNPNVGGAGGTDFFFFGLTADCSGAGTSGCVVVRNGDGSLLRANVTGGPSGIEVDNYSTAAQASNIYLTGAAAPNLAYKFTQNGLN
jgi:hypothetical protein